MEREIYTFGKTGFAALNTQLNDAESKIENGRELRNEDTILALDERTDRVAVGRRDDTFGFALSDKEQAIADRLVQDKRESLQELKEQGQERNIFGDIDPQIRELRAAQLDLSGGGIEDNRSPEAKASDRGKDAQLTLDPDRWNRAPDEFDFPGVDSGPEFRNDPPNFL